LKKIGKNPLQMDQIGITVDVGHGIGRKLFVEHFYPEILCKCEKCSNQSKARSKLVERMVAKKRNREEEEDRDDVNDDNNAPPPEEEEELNRTEKDLELLGKTLNDVAKDIDFYAAGSGRWNEAIKTKTFPTKLRTFSNRRYNIPIYLMLLPGKEDSKPWTLLVDWEWINSEPISALLDPSKWPGDHKHTTKGVVRMFTEGDIVDCNFLYDEDTKIFKTIPTILLEVIDNEGNPSAENAELLSRIIFDIGRKKHMDEFNSIGNGDGATADGAVPGKNSSELQLQEEIMARETPEIIMKMLILASYYDL